MVTSRYQQMSEVTKLLREASHGKHGRTSLIFKNAVDNCLGKKIHFKSAV